MGIISKRIEDMIFGVEQKYIYCGNMVCEESFIFKSTFLTCKLGLSLISRKVLTTKALKLNAL